MTMTNKDFNLDHVGKRMPYTTPDGFFDKLEENIWQEVKADCRAEANEHTGGMRLAARGQRSVRLLVRSVLAVAASVALVLVVHMSFRKSDVPTDHDVDQAFSQLTADDQAYLLSVYQEDVFIHE